MLQTQSFACASNCMRAARSMKTASTAASSIVEVATSWPSPATGPIGRQGTHRFSRPPSALKVRSFLIDGEAVACDGDGMPVFDRLRYRRQDARVFLFAFNLLELNGEDLRRAPLEIRKRQHASLLRSAKVGLQFNHHLDLPGGVVFRHACKLGFEGIVSKRLGSCYRSGRSPDGLKMKNHAAPAVKREAEEEWGKKKWR